MRQAGTEKELQKYTRKECKDKGLICLKFASPSVRGVPDLIIINRIGHVCFVELKSPKGTGRLSTLQKYWIAMLKNHHCHVEVISQYDEIDQLTDRLCAEI